MRDDVPVTTRRRFRVTGTVQGVGFRPHVHRLATRLGLSGFVRNDSFGVLLEVEGDVATVDEFRSALLHDPPALAVIEAFEEEDAATLGDVAFTIEPSVVAADGSTPIPPDLATCAACFRELFDPLDRRYRYPFINCTACGPRFTITRRVPYDRINTTMSSFDMCRDCRREYDDPADRRFHAEPIACPRCGPQLRLFSAGRVADEDAISGACGLIGSGEIVAIKGLGGYHLACDATDEAAVARLRRRKGRDEKPFAVMVADLDAAARLVALDDAERRQLTSHRAPILLARRRAGALVAPNVAPGNAYLGVMLPYTPVHHLLMRDLAGPIVLTSGNISEEPLVYRDEDAERLEPIADAFLTHDRDIHMRCDDTVLRVDDGAPYLVRRSRGFTPGPFPVATAFSQPILGVGAELKNTFCIGMGNRAILSHHIGDLENWDTFRSFSEGIEHFQNVFDVTPAVVAHDLHPDYLSTKWARGLEGVELTGVQHHHAHVASCLADNQRSERVIGVALDGTGFGDDGTVWGGEVLDCDLVSYERAAHLRCVPMPGGAAAIREPWRMAVVYLDAAFGAAAGELRLPVVDSVQDRRGAILQMAAAGINSPATSSAGRLFDAAAAVCGLRAEVTYEGQAAAELEQAADPVVRDAYACPVSSGVIDGVALIRAVAEDVAAGRPPAHVAAAFHNGLAGGLAEACSIVREERGLSTVALTGGSFQNLLLLNRLRTRLLDLGFEVLTHSRVPPNDGGISLGQAVVANARLS